MLLVLGLSAFFRTVGEGTFHCPRCGGDRPYRRRAGRRWVTLFLLPAVPLWRLGESVECRRCRGRFGASALRTPTAAQMAAALPAGMRAAVGLVLRAGDPSDGAARARAADTVRRYGETGYDEAALDADLVLRERLLEAEVVRAGSAWRSRRRSGSSRRPSASASRTGLSGTASGVPCTAWRGCSACPRRTGSA
ncbi:hypothetical protein GEV43_02875 [Actinomadura sp. J1-007]|uniref:hypothetical protein n=1 Tax=Actinomadura sp. J1-007 TaxID=2661913 RepID=UPI00132893B1|nr:hypothetical protein [Actinomadura sp. J1-007]MWK33091.1 hypothetical protein [Actinomadura sp. J1-007]